MLRLSNYRYTLLWVLAVLLLLQVWFFVSDKTSESPTVAYESTQSNSRVARSGFAIRHVNYSSVDQAIPTMRIEVGDKFPHTFWLAGAVFDSSGVQQHINVSVQTSLVHSFSPMAEAVFRDAMVDPLKLEQRIYANSPAIVWKDGELVVVMRIWLEKEKLDLAKYRLANVFSDNYFITQTFDKKFLPTKPGQVMGIPTRVHVEVGDGPIEPRLFEVDGRLYVTFNTAVMISHHAMIDTTFIWDFYGQRCITPNVSGGQPMTKHNEERSLPRDKHWSAYIDKSKLYFVYNIDPLRILNCDMPSGNCRFVHFEGPSDYEFVQAKDTLRGGTPFVLYRYPYYLSIAHGTMFMSCNSSCNWRRYYTANLVVLSVHPHHRIVYTSDDIRFHPKIASSIPIVRFKYIRYPFIFPVSLILEDSDTLAIGGHVSDYSSVVLRLRGLRKIMQHVDVMTSSAPGGGPPVGTLHRYIKEAAKKSTGFSFQW